MMIIVWHNGTRDLTCCGVLRGITVIRGSDRKLERKNMKTLKLLSLTATLVALLTSTAFANGRGNLPTTSKAFPRSAPVGVAKASTMSCPSETRTVVDRSGGRGAGPKVSTYTAHLCPTCSTKEVVKGNGKLAKRSFVHSCDTAGVCCNTTK